MIQILLSEHLKTRRSFARLSLFLFPLLTILLAIFLLSGNLVQISAYNWWYLLILPATLSIICIATLHNDKKLHYVNLYVLPLKQTRLYIGKMIMASIYLLMANLFLFAGTLLTGFLFGRQFNWYTGLAASLLLTLTYIWQIPLCFLLIRNFGVSITFILTILLNMMMSSQPIAASKAWLIPYSIPSRLMAYVIKVNPNGVPVEETSYLNSNWVMLPGILVSCLMICLVTFIMCHQFTKEKR